MPALLAAKLKEGRQGQEVDAATSSQSQHAAMVVLDVPGVFGGM